MIRRSANARSVSEVQGSCSGLRMIAAQPERAQRGSRSLPARECLAAERGERRWSREHSLARFHAQLLSEKLKEREDRKAPNSKGSRSRSGGLRRSSNLAAASLSYRANTHNHVLNRPKRPQAPQRHMWGLSWRRVANAAPSSLSFALVALICVEKDPKRFQTPAGVLERYGEELDH